MVISPSPSGSFAGSVIAYHADYKDDFGINMPMVVANDPLVACACRVRRERDARQLCEPFEQLILEGRLGGFAGRRLLALVMPVAAADLCLGLFAHGEPALCARTRFKIDRRPGPAHPGPHPTWIDSVRENA